MRTLSFEGSGAEYFKIWIVNILLTIITFGIYHPWAKVRNHRYFYANSILDNKNFEYHATGKQLFIGYLIAVILFIIYQVVANFFPIASLFFILALAVAVPWLIWRSMRFNMNVTSFNNVKFKFIGSLGKSYIIYLLYPIVLFALIGALIAGMVSIESIWSIAIGMLILFIFYTLGTAYISYKKNSYLINSSMYGKAEFNTNLNLNMFVKIALKTLLLSIGLYVFFGLILAGIAYVSIENIALLKEIHLYKDQPEVIKPILISMYPLLIGLYFSMIIIAIISLSYYFVKTREYIFDNTIFDNKIEFASSLKFLKLTYIIITNFLAIFMSVGLATPWAKVRVTRYTLENTHVSSDESLTHYLNEKHNKESAVGEEIGDVFDVDVGLAI